MKYCITPDFEAIIGRNRLESFNNHPTTVYGLDSELQFSYLNPAWFAFAEDNGNPIFVPDDRLLGKRILDAIPQVLQPFYEELFDSALRENQYNLTPRQSQYECSSPELYRLFSMHLYPLGKNGIVVVHSLVIEEPHKASTEGRSKLDPSHYTDQNGMIHQCANCRRIQNLVIPDRWDWIPKWVQEPHAKTSHVICQPCKQHYYSTGKERPKTEFGEAVILE